MQYNTSNDGLEQFVIPSSVIPSEVHMIMKYPLFAAGTDTASLAASSQVGELIVDVPRFQFNGNVELSLTASGAATSSLSGSALAVNTTSNCNDMGSYGTVKMNIFGSNWYDNLVNMAVDGADINLSTTGSETLRVIGIFRNNGTVMTGILNNANLTFTSGSDSVATVSTAGVVSAAGAGNTTIEIKATDKPTVTCYANVDVTA